MSLATAFTVFIVIAAAELPDKTMIATLVMGSRGFPLFVWIGATLGFLVHVALAVLAGQLLTHLPHRLLEIIVTVLFLCGGLFLLLVPEKSQQKEGEQDASEERGAQGLKVIASAFGVILVGEFGDLTQLLTVNFVAKTHDPAAVALGAGLALASVAAVGAFGGRALLRVLPLSVIRRVGGVVLLGFAAFTIYQLIAG